MIQEPLSFDGANGIADTAVGAFDDDESLVSENVEDTGDECESAESEEDEKPVDEVANTVSLFL